MGASKQKYIVTSFILKKKKNESDQR
jgi:hypothetical protein